MKNPIATFLLNVMQFLQQPRNPNTNFIPNTPPHNLQTPQIKLLSLPKPTQKILNITLQCLIMNPLAKAMLPKQLHKKHSLPKSRRLLLQVNSRPRPRRRLLDNLYSLAQNPFRFAHASDASPQYQPRTENGKPNPFSYPAPQANPKEKKSQLASSSSLTSNLSFFSVLV